LIILTKNSQLNNASSTGGYLQIILLVAFLIPAILFMLTQRSTLRAVRSENRRIQPGLIWLQLIPVFGFVWQFIVVFRISDSIRKEIESRQDDSILGLPDAAAVEELGKRPTLNIGLAYCICITISVCMQLGKIDQVPILIYIIGLLFWSGTTCWIIYWVKLARYKTKLVRIQ
jgi:hypothetical protein